MPNNSIDSTAHMAINDPNQNSGTLPKINDLPVTLTNSNSSTIDLADNTIDTHSSDGKFDSKPKSFFKNIPEYLSSLFKRLTQSISSAFHRKSAEDNNEVNSTDQSPDKMEQKSELKNPNSMTTVIANNTDFLPKQLSKEIFNQLLKSNIEEVCTVLSTPNLQSEHFLQTSVAISKVVIKHPDLSDEYDPAIVKTTLRKAFDSVFNERTPGDQLKVIDNILSDDAERAREVIDSTLNDLIHQKYLDKTLLNRLIGMEYVMTAIKSSILNFNSTPFEPSGVEFDDLRDEERKVMQHILERH